MACNTGVARRFSAGRRATVDGEARKLFGVGGVATHRGGGPGRRIKAALERGLPVDDDALPVEGLEQLKHGKVDLLGGELLARAWRTIDSGQHALNEKLGEDFAKLLT